jgi:hypothetical protein
MGDDNHVGADMTREEMVKWCDATAEAFDEMAEDDNRDGYERGGLVADADVLRVIRAAIAAPATAQSGMEAGLREAMKIARRAGHGGVAEAIEAAIPATAQGVGVMLPRASDDEAKAGWTLPMTLLSKWLEEATRDGFGQELILEEVEAIALAVERHIQALTPPAPWKPPPEAERPDGYSCLIWVYGGWEKGPGGGQCGNGGHTGISMTPPPPSPRFPPWVTPRVTKWRTR